MEHVPIAIALVDKHGAFLARSARWQELQSKLFTKWQSRNFLLSISSREDWTAAFKRVLRGETVRRDEDTLLMVAGTKEYAKWEARPWISRNGTVEGGVLSIALITEQVQARKRAEEQSEFFNAVLESIDNGIVACDADGRLTMFNARTR
ncbi:PAS domain-containing protein [Roseibium alexandrii]|uniref:PAS domain-containing protein n=1 Tax=Roseibium alexandrii TaxID=388408 RepID=UPI00375117EA